MADLITHLATGLLLKAGWRTHTPIALLGTVLPDLAGRVPGMVASRVDRAGLELPDLLIHGSSVAHFPLGMVALCGVIALGFREGQRKAVFANLLAGCAIHLAVDLLQWHTGVGYPLLFPFSTWHWEAGLIGSEATVPWAFPLLAVSSAVWWVAGRWTTGRRPPPPAGSGSLPSGASDRDLPSRPS